MDKLTECTRISEGFEADVAFQRLLIRVDVHVLSQSLLCRESFVADLADMRFICTR